MSPLALAIRSVRKGCQMTTTEFARELGVAQSVVSRYERDERSPGWRPLMKLLLLARGDEQIPILDALADIRRQPVTREKAIEEALRMAREDDFLHRVQDYMALNADEKFAWLALKVIHAKIPVHESLISIIELWISSYQSPLAARRFEDAARYLRAAAAPGGTQPEPLNIDILRTTGTGTAEFAQPEVEEQDEAKQLAGRKLKILAARRRKTKSNPA